MIKENSIQYFTQKELFEDDIPDRNWVFQGLLGQGQLVFLQGAGKSMKSLLTLELCIRLAARSKFLELYNTPGGRSVFLENEDGGDDTRRRIRQIVSTLADEEKAMLEENLFIAKGKTNFNTKNIQSVIETIHPTLLVLSSYSHILLHNEIENENDNIATIKVLSALSSLAEIHNCCILVIHHFSKSAILNGNGGQGAGRGAIAIENTARQIINVVRNGEDNTIKLDLNICNFRHELRFKELNLSFENCFEISTQTFKKKNDKNGKENETENCKEDKIYDTFAEIGL